MVITRKGIVTDNVKITKRKYTKKEDKMTNPNADSQFALNPEELQPSTSREHQELEWDDGHIEDENTEDEEEEEPDYQLLYYAQKQLSDSLKIIKTPKGMEQNKVEVVEKIDKLEQMMKQYLTSKTKEITSSSNINIERKTIDAQPMKETHTVNKKTESPKKENVVPTQPIVDKPKEAEKPKPVEKQTHLTTVVNAAEQAEGADDDNSDTESGPTTQTKIS
jgi:hypothetical protein